MRFVSFNDFAKRSHRAALSLPVVRHFGQPSLHLCGCVQPLNESPLLGCEVFFTGYAIHCLYEVSTESGSDRVMQLSLLDGHAMIDLMWNDTDVPLGYLITFRCYGTWLQGDTRGSIDRFHNRCKSS